MSSGQLHCIEGDEGIETDSRQFHQLPIYDCGTQHFIVDRAGRMQVLQNANNGSVIFTESETAQFQELHQEELKYAIDDDMDLMAVEDSSSDAITQITLDEEQCRQLEEHGRLVLQHEDRHYMLDHLGLRELTNDIETIEDYDSGVLTEENIILPNSGDTDEVNYEDMDVDITEGMSSSVSIEIEPQHQISLLQQDNGIDIEDNKISVAELVMNQENSIKSQREKARIGKESQLQFSLYRPDQLTILPKSRAVKPQVVNNVVDLTEINGKATIVNDTTIDTNGKQINVEPECVVKVKDSITINGIKHPTVTESVHIENNKPKQISKAALSRFKTSSKSMLQTSVLQNARNTVQNETSISQKLLENSKEEIIDCSALPQIMQKYLQTPSGMREWRSMGLVKKDVKRTQVPQKIKLVQKVDRLKIASAVESVPRFMAPESLQTSKKELQLFTSQYGISWRDDTDSLKLKLTSKLPPGICDLKNKKIPIGPTKTGKRLIGKILSVVRPQNTISCRSVINHNKTDKPVENSNPEQSDEEALESLIKSALQSTERDCTGEDLASTEKILEGLMRIESVSEIMADRDVAVVKVALERKDDRLLPLDVKYVVCGRMGMFSDPVTECLEWKFMYMPDLINRRNCTDGDGVDEFEVTADGVPYRRNAIREDDDDSEAQKRPSDRPLLQVRILESFNERGGNKDSKIIIVESSSGGMQNKLVGNSTPAQSTPRPIVRDVGAGKSFECNLCGKYFASMMQYTKHLSVDHRIKWVSCYHCNKIFNRPSNLQRHLRIHSSATDASPMDLAPESPEASLDSPQSADDTIADDSGKKKRTIYKCELCPCSYYYSSTLTRHIINAHILANGKSEPEVLPNDDPRVPCSCTVLSHSHNSDKLLQ